MKIAVVGGGINGLCTAWQLKQKGHSVTLYERGRLMEATSAASSKLLHGGLRYLETGQFRLIREALQERDAWIQRVPQLSWSLPIILPVYKTNRRSCWQYGLGLKLYDVLAGKTILPKSEWLSREQTIAICKDIKAENLVGGYRYYDGQMDDRALGLWVAEQCRLEGADLCENVEVIRAECDGTLFFANGQHSESFDHVFNIAGPWAQRLLMNSGVRLKYSLDLVRGSHIIVKRKCFHALILEVPDEKRIFFVLPWKTQTLVGTTEIRQSIETSVVCTDDEKNYLLNAYNHYHVTALSLADISGVFAGVRPLVHSSDNPSKATRDYVVQRDKKLTTVFGGKWTTSMALARKLTTYLK